MCVDVWLRGFMPQVTYVTRLLVVLSSTPSRYQRATTSCVRRLGDVHDGVYRRSERGGAGAVLSPLPGICVGAGGKHVHQGALRNGGWHLGLHAASLLHPRHGGGDSIGCGPLSVVWHPGWLHRRLFPWFRPHVQRVRWGRACVASSVRVPVWRVSCLARKQAEPNLFDHWMCCVSSRYPTHCTGTGGRLLRPPLVMFAGS